MQANVTTMSTWDIPVLSSIPWIGDVFFKQDPITYISYLAVPACWWLLFRARWGTLLRAAGEQWEAFVAYGVSGYIVSGWLMLRARRSRAADAG